jgi:hypothetical protein
MREIYRSQIDREYTQSTRESASILAMGYLGKRLLGQTTTGAIYDPPSGSGRSFLLLSNPARSIKDDLNAISI